ncbi:hypothetical protein ACOMHN_052879 [Nucella lapillus]
MVMNVLETIRTVLTTLEEKVMAKPGRSFNARERENAGHSAWQDNYGRSHDTPHNQSQARHGNIMNRERNEIIVNGFQKSPTRNQLNSPSEKWNNDCEDSALRWGVLNQQHGSAGEGVQRVAGTSTSPNGKHKVVLAVFSSVITSLTAVVITFQLP